MEVLFEVKDRIAYVAINRPEVMNAMNAQAYSLLSKTWIDIRDNQNIWVAIITGTGDKSFTTGADLKSSVVRERKKVDFFLTQKDMM